MNKIETERAEALEKLLSEKAQAEKVIADFGGDSMKGRKAASTLAKFDARVADLNRTVSELAIQAFISAPSNAEANEVAAAFKAADDGFYSGMRLRYLISLRPDFVWLTKEFKPYNDLYNPNHEYQSDNGWRWFGD